MKHELLVDKFLVLAVNVREGVSNRDGSSFPIDDPVVKLKLGIGILALFDLTIRKPAIVDAMGRDLLDLRIAVF